MAAEELLIRCLQQFDSLLHHISTEWDLFEVCHFEFTVRNNKNLLCLSDSSGQFLPSLEALILTLGDLKNSASSEEHSTKINHSTTKLKKRRQRNNACKVCRKRFADPGLLRHHLDIVHGSSQKKLSDWNNLEGPSVCSVCYKSYRNAGDFSTSTFHLNCCSGQLMSVGADLLRVHKKFLCGYCEEEFRTFARMDYHVSKCPGGPFTCDLCGQSGFTFSRDLTLHRATEHSTEKPFACSECTLRFKLNTSLQKHLVKRHERPPESFVCDKCPKKFIKKVYLTHHKSRFHNLSKPFLCQVCGETFLAQSSLKSHMEIHDGTKRFNCGICNLAFRRRDKLNIHLAVHTGHRPFECNVCHLKSFVTRSKLAEHLRRHAGEKRFACLVCNKMYSGSHDLRKHLKKSHPNISKNIKPNVPLTPQIIANISLVSEPEQQQFVEQEPEELVLDYSASGFIEQVKDLEFPDM